MIRLMSFAVLLSVTPVSAAVPVAVHGKWGAVDRGARCDALAQAVRKAAPGGVQAMAGFAFVRGAPGGRFHARLGRVPRAGASIVAEVGRQRFLLAGGNGLAWSRDGGQDQAIMAALRGGGWLRITARDGRGRRFSDSYALDGAATAIDAAAAQCARSAGKKP